MKSKLTEPDVHRLFGNSVCTNSVECVCHPLVIEDGNRRLWIHQPEKYAAVVKDVRVILELAKRGK